MIRKRVNDVNCRLEGGMCTHVRSSLGGQSVHMYMYSTECIGIP